MTPAPPGTDAALASTEQYLRTHGIRPLSDHAVAQLGLGAATVVSIGTSPDDSPIEPLAIITVVGDGWQVEVLPGLAPRPADLPHLMARVAASIAALGGGVVDLWLFGQVDYGIDEAATDRGIGSLAPHRTLWQMRTPLPLVEPHQRTAIATRPFRPGVDDEPWLAANRAAFADHPEQGTWTLDTLRQRMAEPWFQPEGFLIHDIDGRVAAFCWTKVHEPTAVDPVLGEIYVIGVDPAFQGRGLGRALTVAGLASLSDRGIHQAMLHVAAENHAATRLYESLGFTLHHADRALRGRVLPDPAS